MKTRYNNGCMMPDSGEIQPEEAPQAPVTPIRLRPRRPRSGPDVRRRRRRMVGYLMLFVSAAFMVNALVGDNGLLGTLKAKKEYNDLNAQIRALRLENARLQEEARRLHDDPSAIEEAARRELGMIRPGEVLVIVKDAPPAGSGPGQ